jgi:hypothetical protein
MTSPKFVNGVDTKICGAVEDLRCWGVAHWVLLGFANLLSGEKPYE